MSIRRDLLTMYDTGAIQYPKIHNRILELTTPALVVRQLFQDAPVTEGRTITFVKEKGVNAVGISLAAEGGPAKMDFTNLDYATVTVYKRKEMIEITKETIDDISLPVLEQQLRRLSRRFAMQLDADCFNVLAAVAAANGLTFACTGKTMSVTGTEVTVASTLGMKDLNKARRIFLSKNQIMDGIIVDPIAEEGLRNLPGFVVVDKPATQPDVPEYRIGNWAVKVSNLIPAGTAYAYSNGTSVNGEYNPLGFLAVKQPIYSDVDISKKTDTLTPMISARYAPVVTNGNCVISITGLATS